VYQSQKVHPFCPSLSFLAEAQPRLDTGEDKRHFLAKDIGKISNLFCIYVFQMDKFINICQQNQKFTMYLQYNYILIHITYDDRAIIGFVANLLNRPTDGAMVSVRKRVTFRPLVST
jgi:hypothetical protein